LAAREPEAAFASVLNFTIWRLVGDSGLGYGIGCF
jgi:hypothetical protein